jgi:RND superfamily putative drug exporter
MATTTMPSPGPTQDGPRSQPAEESGLARIAGWCHDHRWWVLVVWVVVLAAINVFAQGVGSNFTNNLTAGTQPAQQILDQAFPSQSGSPAQVVLTTTGPITAASVQTRTAAMVAALTPLAHVSEVVSPFSAGGTRQISADGHIAYVQVLFDRQAGNLPQAAIQQVITTAQSFAAPGYHVALGGQAISLVAGGKPGPSEGIGVMAAIVIMLIAFGSVVAMGLPIITALFGIGIAFALLDLLSHVITTPVFAPEMMAMIGLGVGIDYALFIVTRYRQGLAEGRSPRQATTVSMATSGRSVVFAGSTVILSLIGLFILRLPFMQGLAVGAIAAVVLVMASAVTLLPAMLGFSGLAVDKLHVPGLLQSGAEPSERGFWYRWSRTVQRRPVLAAVAAVACLVVLIIPFFSMRLAFTDAGNDPLTSTTRQAFDALATGFGPGFNGPLVVAASVPQGRTSTVDALQVKVAATPGVAFATPAQFSPSGRSAVIIAYPATSPPPWGWRWRALRGHPTKPPTTW